MPVSPTNSTLAHHRTQLSRRIVLSGAAGLAVGLAGATGAAADSGGAAASGAARPGGRAKRAVAAAHRALERDYAAPWPQLLHNSFPASADGDRAFHYWWLAHAVDAYLDGYERTGRRSFLADAEQVVAAIRARNGGHLVNDYFDDMNWLALATHRLWTHTQDQTYLDDAHDLWEEIVTDGWNDTFGPSVAWRREQLDYKNTPSNAPFAILSYRLHRESGEDRFAEYGDAALTWMRETLVDPETGFVADGINRQGDGAIDWNWRFTYCQGVWIGALVESARTHGDHALLDEAARTGVFSVRELTAGPVFSPEGQGDGGLFKGIWYRYAALLLQELPDGGARRELTAFIRTSTQALADSSLARGVLLAGPDWRIPAPATTDLATHLSGVMALEAAAAIE
ncbi:glycoside hydrolase family 76 protein [Ruania halotolerans]|uniref:glycoside hydrolase family 76 protein n=1 Tax=Ruania halotolerans TaxID=2897773 RepID=UPI001E5FEAE8|nr:glycoside hydrolase family 76 protein [Ruania halotolerans]UFU06707.1 glycoside hydrolase [Ruania halotolerans]